MWNDSTVSNGARMPSHTEEVSTTDIGEYVAMVKRRWWLLVLVPLLAATSAYWFTSLQAPTYKTSATLYVNQASSQVAGAGGDVRAVNLLTRTYSRLATSPPVLERVIADLGLSQTVPELASQLEASTERDTQIFEISVSSSDPQLAARIANGTGTAFVKWLSELQSVSSSQSVRALQSSIDKARATAERTSSQLAALRSRPGPRTIAERDRMASLETVGAQYQNTYSSLLELQQRLELEQLASQNRVSLVARAEAPEHTSGLPATFKTVLALLLGFAVAGFGVVFLERTNERVRLPDDVYREVPLPVLASIPRSRRSSIVETVDVPQSPVSEAIRSLRARLQFATAGDRIGPMVITSPGPHEGKSIVAANLAVAFAQSGQRVVLVDANLRHPRQSELFGKPSLPGLSNLLTERELQTEELLVYGPHPRLLLLLSGPRPSNPSELLASERLEQVITGLRGTAEVIIIDAPPLLTVSDALLLAASADHAVLVAASGRTRPDTLGTALANLRPAGVNVLGVILNGENRRKARS